MCWSEYRYRASVLHHGGQPLQGDGQDENGGDTGGIEVENSLAENPKSWKLEFQQNNHI